MAAINWLVEGLMVLAAVWLVLIALGLIALGYFAWRYWLARRIMKSGRW